MATPDTYEAWRSDADHDLHVICREGHFDQLPALLQQLGPWISVQQGDVARLRLAYRTLVQQQGFVIVHCDISMFDPELP
jgi:hypothetical protein